MTEGVNCNRFSPVEAKETLAKNRLARSPAAQICGIDRRRTSGVEFSDEGIVATRVGRLKRTSRCRKIR